MENRLKISLVVNILLMAALITVIVQKNSLAAMKTKVDKKPIDSELIVLPESIY